MTIASEQSVSPAVVVSIVHDLGNPLATIRSGAELLAGPTLPQSQIHRIARNMCCASTRMRELLEEMLDRTGAAANGKAPCEIRELVASAVEKIALDAEFQSVHVAQNVPEGLIVVLDRRLIRRVLVNLLVNALQVMPDGGTIVISALSDQHSVLIRVRDTGPGISPEIRSRLFEPFATAGKRGGTGLGLAFSRKAVRDHGGEIWAEPVHAGSCLALRLPKTAVQERLPDSAQSADAALTAAPREVTRYSEARAAI